MNARFAIACAARAQLEREAAAASAAWRAIPGVGSGAMGLTPDAVKFSPEYRAARTAYESAAGRLARLNKAMAREFKAELREERKARRRTA